MVLTLTVLAESVPAQALAANEPPDTYLAENEISEEILASDVFYLGSTQARIGENEGGASLLKLGRGGSAENEATAVVKIADLTAKYGEDYTVRVHDGKERAKVPEDNASLMEMIAGEDFTQTELGDDQDLAGLLKEDEEGQAVLEEGMNAAIDYLKEASGVSEDAIKEELDASGQVASGSDSETDPVQQARSMFTGVEGTSQRVTAEASDFAETYQEMQKMANVITEIVAGVRLEVPFAEGETEKYLEIIPKNNAKGDGNRMFYIVLGAPEGTTTNSAASTCAVTILDDEEAQPAVVSFSDAVYNHEPGAETVTVTLRRSGLMNSIVSAKVTTTEEGSALAGRDYAEVDRTLLFPFGVDHLTVDIPVRTQYFTGDKDFCLKLTAESGCTVEEGNAIVRLRGTYGEETADPDSHEQEEKVEVTGTGADEELTDEGLFAASNAAPIQSNTLGTIRMLPAIRLDQPKWHYNEGYHGEGNFGGDNYYNTGDKRYVMKWKDNRNAWKRFFDFDYDTGRVSAFWELTEDDDAWWISGVRLTWEHPGKDANIVVVLNNYLGYEAYRYDRELCYDSKSRFDHHALSIYPESTGFYRSNTLRYLEIDNAGNCADCDRLWIYGAEPILRPFQINLVQNDTLKFRDENGKLMNYTEGGVQTAIAGGSNNQVVAFLDDNITFSQAGGSNSQKYAMINGLSVASPAAPNSFMKFMDVSPDASKNDVTMSLGKSTIRAMVSTLGKDNFTKAIQSNSYAKNGTYSGDPTYAALRLRVEMEKIPAAVTLKNPYSFPVTVTIDGKDYKLTAGETKKLTGDDQYYLGDKLYTSIRLEGDAAEAYSATGLDLTYRITGAEKNPCEETKYFVDNKPVYVSGTKDQRLNYREVTISPSLQEKSNRIVVRVKTSDLSKFKKSGVLAGDGKVKGDYTEYEFAKEDQTVNGRLYFLPAEPADKDMVCVWYDNGAKRTYEGNTLYFTAGRSPDRNILTLSAGAKKQNLKLKGKLGYMNYNLRTKDPGNASTLPAYGAVVTAGSTNATADEEGRFTTGEIATSGNSGRYLRYLVSVNGNMLLRETSIPEKGGTVDVSSAFSQGVSPVMSEIFKNLTVTPSYQKGSSYSVLDGALLPIAKSEEAAASIRVSPAGYSVLYSDKNGAKELTRTERATGVQLVVYDSTGKQRGKYAEVKTPSYDAYGNATFNVPIVFSAEGGSGGFSVHPGDKLYLRLTTDRDDSAQSAGTGSSYVYSDVFTGYTFVQPTAFEAPVEQGLESPVNLSFGKLDFLGDTGMNLNFPFVNVGYTKIERGYRMYIGVSVGSIVDTVKETHMTSYAGSDGQYWGDLFNSKDPFNSFAGGFSAAWDQAFVSGSDLKGAVANGDLANPSWKFDLTLGVYFDFWFPEVTGNAKTSDYVFAGVGAYVSVSLGFKMAWYFVLPVFFIPIYFGIQIDGYVMGFLGATASGETKITLDDTKRSQVDFNKALNTFTGSVIGSATVQINMGVGLCGTIGVRATGDVKVIGSYEPKTKKEIPDGGAYVALNVGAYADLFLTSLGYSWTVKDWTYGSFDYYKKHRSVSGNLGISGHDDTEAGADEVTKKEAGFSLHEVTEKEAGFTFREVPDTDSVWIGGDVPPEDEAILDSALNSAFAPNPEKKRVLVDKAYERPDSQLITLEDGTVFLAFIDNDNSKGKYQRTTLKLAAMRNGEWSTPVPVCVDETADFQPSIAQMKDGRVLVAWISTGADNITDKTSVTEYLKSMEVYAAFASVGEDGGVTVEKPVRITNDHEAVTGGEAHYYDSMPTVVCDPVTGDAMVYYVKSGIVDGTAEELANPYTNDCVVCYMPYSVDGMNAAVDGQEVKEHWLFHTFYKDEVAGGSEAEKTLIRCFEGQRFLESLTYEQNGESVYYAIPDFTAIGYNGLAVFAYTVDPDGNNNTSEDKELILQVYNFVQHKLKYAVRLTNDTVADTLPQFIRTKSDEAGRTEAELEKAADTKLFWYRNNADICYISVTDLIKEGISDTGVLLHKTEEDGTPSDETWADPRYVATLKKDSHAAGQMADFKVAQDADGSLYILWTEGVDQAREIYAASLLDDNTDKNGESVGTGWSKPYRLTRDGLQNDELSVTLVGEDLLVVHNQFRQEQNLKEDGSIDEKEPLIFSDLQLVSETMNPCGAMETEKITLSAPVNAPDGALDSGEDKTEERVFAETDLPLGGSEVILTAEVWNNGLSAAKGHKITLYAVDKNGVETKIGEQESTETVRPGAFESHEFSWTLPEDVEGLSFKAVVRESRDWGKTYFVNSHEFVSDPVKKSAAYEIRDVETEQLADGFHVRGTLINNGNADGAEGEELTVRFSGPFNMELAYPEKELILYQGQVQKLATGESTDFDVSLKLPEGVMAEYGFIDATVSVRRAVTVRESGEISYETTEALGEEVNTEITLTMPTGFTVSAMSIGAGETGRPEIRLNTEGRFDEAVSFYTEDTDIARIETGSDGTVKVLGITPGMTELYAVHDETGAAVSARILVGGEIPAEDIPSDGEIPEGIWVVVAPDADSTDGGYHYTGKAVKPTVRVYDHVNLLTEGTDYKLKYRNNVKAYALTKGDAGFNADQSPAVQITGKGKYSMAETSYFPILPIDISLSNTEVYAEDLALAYTGKVLKPAPVLTWNGKKLKNGSDFSFRFETKKGESLSGIKDIGEYAVILTGAGGFTGTRSIGLTVYDKNKCKPVSKLKIGKPAAQKYTGSALTPAVTVKNGNMKLTSGTDYTVTYQNNVSAGTGYAIIRGVPSKGTAGSKRVAFKITGTGLRGAKLEGIPKAGYVYTGSPVTLDALLKSGEVKLTAKGATTALTPYDKTTGKGDFRISYKNNIKAGTATAIFTGVNGCTGTLKKTFKIAKKDLADEETVSVTFADGAAEGSIVVPFDKNGSKPAVTVLYRGRSLTEGKDYTVSYKNNRKAGASATVTVKGKGSFTGIRKLTFTVGG